MIVELPGNMGDANVGTQRVIVRLANGAEYMLRESSGGLQISEMGGDRLVLGMHASNIVKIVSEDKLLRGTANMDYSK